MKTKLLFSMLALAVMVSAFGQRSTMELSFSATYYDETVPLDSILIENITQGGDTMLYSPDNVLVLYITSISNYSAKKESCFSVSQNYPNPFKDQTTINIHMHEKEKIEIHIRDVFGREVASYKNTLNMGNHTFTFYPGNEKCYLLTVCGVNSSETIKMLVARSNTTITSCEIVYTSINSSDVGFKSKQAKGDFVFSYGDELRYTGFALTVNDVNGSDVIEDVPLENEDYDFEITEGIPCPGIPTITYEGLVYNTVQIGDQCWMKENLNVGMFIFGYYEMSDDGVIEKYCLENDTINCDKYGGLYLWSEMMQYTYTNGGQGICPDGWHIPTDEEIKILEGTVDTQYPVGDPEWDQMWAFRGSDVCFGLKSVIGWGAGYNGTDLYGFMAMRSGGRAPVGSFYSTNYSLWSSTIDLYSMFLWRWVTATEPDVYRGVAENEYGFSVRCIKDD